MNCKKKIKKRIPHCNFETCYRKQTCFFFWPYFWSTQLITMYPKWCCLANFQEKKTWSHNTLTDWASLATRGVSNPILQTCCLCLPAFWWYFATLFVIHTYQLARSLRSSSEKLLKTPRINLKFAGEWHFVMLLLLFGTSFQTAFAMFPHSRLANISWRPTCFIKLFPTHSRFLFLSLFFLFSCLVLWVLLDFAPYKISLYYYYIYVLVSRELVDFILKNLLGANYSTILLILLSTLMKMSFICLK